MHLQDTSDDPARPEVPRGLPCTLEIGDKINFNVCSESGVNVAGVMIEFYNGKLVAHVYEEWKDEPQSVTLAADPFDTLFGH